MAKKEKNITNAKDADLKQEKLQKVTFKQFIKDMTGITIDPLEYTIEVYSTIIKLIILFISVIFITLLFNT
jgi:hypothetical protein